ncbi:MAG: TadE/TadG family type IV pilus assembly protein [Planctomycetales bacterium]|jgi:Flp pilus assembly protein TadG
MKQLMNRQHNRRGAAIVEMALVLPIFFAVVLGIVEFGRAMMVSQMVTNAAREATRLAIIDGSTNTTVETWVEEFLNDSINVTASDVTVTITVVAAPGNDDPNNQIGNAQARDLVTINVSVPFDKVSYVPGSYLNGKSLSTQSSMRHE